MSRPTDIQNYHRPIFPSSIPTELPMLHSLHITTVHYQSFILSLTQMGLCIHMEKMLSRFLWTFLEIPAGSGPATAPHKGGASIWTKVWFVTCFVSASPHLSLWSYQASITSPFSTPDVLCFCSCMFSSQHHFRHKDSSHIPDCLLALKQVLTLIEHLC